jgi:Fungal specific transcription factor domain/Fungal Zn(2)-Cys(6) binuclear cluster domain
MSSRKVAKRACDGCKVRKVRCDISEVSPCTGCVAAGIACTTLKPPAARGPRRLRRSTLQEITETQQQWESLAVPTPVGPVVHNQLDTESVFAPSKVAALALQLCVYRLRCYAVWPIIKVERLLASLQKPDPDIEVFALAYAVAAATIAQIRTKDQTGGVTAEMMEAQCQFARVRRKDGPPDLTTCRIPFFLHIYYENLDPGGLKSITYLREAIAVAHMIGLHRESYYANVEPAEQEIRRRTLWLLFVTER